MTRRIVVTGLGTITALGSETGAFWQRLCEGQSGIGPITVFDTTDFKVKFAGQVRDFEPEKYIDAHEAKRIDRFAQFALGAADIAVRDSGIDFSSEDPGRCGAFFGSGIGGLHEIEEQHTRLMEKGPGRVSPFMIPKLMVNAAPGQVSIRYGLNGPCSSVATACASSSNAIGDAFKILQRGDAEVMIAGGSEAAVCPMGLSGFIALRALSTRNDQPAAASRPFDRDRDGFVLSEGAAVMVLEDLEHATKRGAKIYAELVGYGMSCDGNHITAPDPEGTGAARAMAAALRDAALNPEQIDYINAHGTSTPLGDTAETKAIKRVFGHHAHKVPVSSTKSQLGHLLGASGAVELLISILAIHHGVVPPTINYTTPDPDCDLDYVPNVARSLPVRHVMSNSFAFGGHNTALIVARPNGRP
jgi:3-oxoacyl-[acyl-carrier-protein] synthase II